MDVIAFNLVEFWGEWIGPVLLLVVGLGLVIFVHELGHFLAAKWVGIKVERFALGFGPRLFGIRRGETDYCIKALPVGGYVKMLGQEDFAPMKDIEGLDPRSFEAKSVGARFFVVSAGVIMNVIFGAILFIIVGLIGKNFTQPVVGAVRPTYPAAKVKFAWIPAVPATHATSLPANPPAFGPGLKPGDRVVELDGDPITRFSDLKMKAILASGEHENFKIVVKRRDQENREWIGTGRVGLKKAPDGSMLVFGIGTPSDTAFAEFKDIITDTPFRDGDRLVAINSRKIEHHWQIDAIEETLDGNAVTVTIERKGDNHAPEIIHVRVQPDLMTKTSVFWLKDGRRLRGHAITSHEDSNEKLARFELLEGGEREIPSDQITEYELLDIMGMIPRFRFSAVTRGTPAEDAGLRVGDIVIAYGDHGTPTFRDFLEVSKKVVGRETPIVVLRDGKHITTKVVPVRKNGAAQIGVVPGVDLMHAVVGGVREDSAGHKGRLTSGDVVEKINSRPVASWIDVFNSLKQLSEREVTVTYRRGVHEHTAVLGKPDKSVFDPQDYDMHLFPVAGFRPLQFRLVKRNPISAVTWGAGETWNFIVTTYATLRALIRKTVSPKTLVGPVGIGGLAIQVGRERPLIDFVYFLAFISATLAVINFLPLPVVDGGLAVFLLIEKIRRKPIPIRIMNIVQFTGLALIIVVFVLLTWQDVARWWGSRW